MNKFIERGEQLPSAAKIVAVGSYVPLLDKHPIIGKIDPKHWDFFLTIGGTFVAISQLNHENIPKQDRESILDVITKKAVEAYPNSTNACEDCRSFFDRTCDRLEKEGYDQQFLSSDAIGTWVVWNLFGHKPENEDEINLIRPIGISLVASFISWWK